MVPHDDLREECCAANQRLSRLGLVDLTFGNVSVADHERRVFAIKPSGVDYEALTPSDMVLVDFDGKILSGSLRPSSDTPTHRRLFLAFGGGVRSIVHTHSRHAVAFAQAGRSIPCLGTTHADHFHGQVPVTRPMQAAEIASDYEWNTGGVIVERFEGLNPSEIPAVLVHGHGPFVWGASAEEALNLAIALEVVAEMALKTLQLTPNAPPLALDLMDRHFRRKHGPGATYGQAGATSFPDPSNRSK